MVCRKSAFRAATTQRRPNLLFDRGTVLLQGVGLGASVGPLVPDPRVGMLRAPGMAYAEAAAELRRRGVDFVDQVDGWSARPLMLPGRELPLRPYQREALWAWERAGRRGLVCLPTGAGKTRVGLAAVASVGLPALILVPTRVLLHQWAARIGEHLGLRPGLVGDGNRRLAEVTVATFESAYRHVEWLGDKFALLVADEVHHFGSGNRAEALEGSAAPFRLGLTATPPLDQERLARLKFLVGPVVAEVSLGRLTGTYLAPFERIVIPVELTAGERVAYERQSGVFLREFRRFKAQRPGGTWPEFVDWARQEPEGLQAVAAWHRAQEILSTARQKLLVVGQLLERHAERRVLVFTRSNAAAYEVSRLYLVPVVTHHVSRRERVWILEAFRQGRVRAIVSSRVLNEGLDVPEADVAVLLGGALGLREFRQRVGRVLRGGPGKRAVIYEVVVAESPESRRLAEHAEALVEGA